MPRRGVRAVATSFRPARTLPEQGRPRNGLDSAVAGQGRLDGAVPIPTNKKARRDVETVVPAPTYERSRPLPALAKTRI
jgi:hypothetical protein